LKREHQGFALAYRSVLDALGGAAAAAEVLRRCGGRPRLAARTLVDATEAASGTAAIVVFFDLGLDDSCNEGAVPAPPAPPPSKRQRTDPKQVRIRHVLLKHRDCKNPVDKVRSRAVTRSRAEAERLLRKVLEECEADPKRRSAIFAQRCRELSECQSSLRGGDLAGDLAWVQKGKMGASFEAAAFALHVGQLSDIVDSDLGIHILWRTA